MEMEKKDIEIDLDRVRIRDILGEAYRGCSDVLRTDFDISEEDFVSKINPYLNTNRVTIPVLIHLPSRKFPELKIEVNLRQKKVFARMISRSKQALVNRFLKVL